MIGRRLSLATWSLLLALAAIVGWIVAAGATPLFGREGAGLLGDCAPSYLALDPDYGAIFTFRVMLPESKIRLMVFGSYPRCIEAQRLVAELLEAVPVSGVTVSACR